MWKYGRVGIYKISSLSHPERIYIGGSTNIMHRWYDHKKHLAKGIYHAPHFIEHYNKYGVHDLILTILEQFKFQSKTHLIEREQFYMDSLKPYFNKYPTAGSPRGYKQTQEQKDHISESLKVMGHKPPSTLGMKHSKECSKKHREINLRLGLVPPSRKGIKYTEEQRKRANEKRRLTVLRNNLKD